jgi:hypothetical protein
VKRAAVAALALLAVLSGCGGGGSGSADSGAEAAAGAPTDPFREVRRDAERPAVLRAAPRWERVALEVGTGQGTRTAAISREAIQWRARWRCERGAFALSAADGTSLARGRCPDRGVSTAAAATGRQRLGVRADGRWRVEVEQQVDTALREPPLRAMRSRGARVLAAGRFYGLERRGGGSAALYRLPGGRLALRLDDLETSPNSDLYVWVSQAPRPGTSRAAFRSRHVSIAPLASTLGDQNYLLPAGVRARDVRSVVIWCEPVRIAYAAASLRAR